MIRDTTKDASNMDDRHRPISGHGAAAKRATDVAVSAVALLVLAPLFVGAALAIVISMGRPVFFRQTRPGYLGKPFNMLKFRTMVDTCDVNGRLLPASQRITPVGGFLRRWSIDELPQLWNVLRGEMSLVGPRPLLMEYLQRYSREQKRRHDVKPGITGWAQVNGRNAISWDAKFDLDLWYVDNWSLTLDMKIIGMTIAKVVQRAGIMHSRTTTMPRFMGSGNDSQEDTPE